MANNSDKSSESIAVIIPCYNEEITVESVIKDVAERIPKATIYVYDNNSTDATAEIAAKTGLCEIRKAPIQGKGAAVRLALTEIDAEYYLLIDGDATYKAKDALKITDAIMARNGEKMIVGDRLTKSYKGQKATHAFGNHLVDKLIRLKFKNKDVLDTMSGLRVFDKDIAKGFAAESKYNGFEIETELVIWCANHNYKMRSISCEYNDRPKGSESKLNTFKDGWRIIKLILKTKRKN